MPAEKTSKRPIQANDLFRLIVVGDPQVSPDGSSVAWVETTLDKEKDLYRSAIWVVSADGGQARRLTSGTSRDRSPQWSPDGSHIAFVSNRPAILPAPKTDEEDEKSKPEPKPQSQIWVIALDGGEADQITNQPNGTGSPAWSHDSTKIAFVGNDDVPTNADFQAPMTKGDQTDEMIVRDVRYRGDGQGFIERYAHIWTINLADKSAQQLTDGDVFDGEPAWSPDDSVIAFVGNRREDRKLVWGASTILTVPSNGGDIKAIAPDDALFSTPAWSPDGSRIAFAGCLDAKAGGARNATLWTVSPDGSNVTNHTPDWDFSIGDAGMSDVFMSGTDDLIWQDDNTVLVLAPDHGATQIYSVSLESGTGTAVTRGPQRVAGFSYANGTSAYLIGTINKPFEVFVQGSGSNDLNQISHANDTFLEEVELRDAEDLTSKAPDGREIQGWLITPTGFDESSSAKHPLILQIHGGPHSMYGYAMFHEMQLMAAKGYGVVFCNPRGSSGYGEEFRTCTREIWGEADMPDVIAAVETAAQRSWVDTGRLGITGGSYGGYLTNWVIGHDTRFKAAVTQRCVSNFHSFIGTSDIGTNFGVLEFGGVPWKDSEKLLRYSPISYADKIETPLLILHSEQDLRCPIEQGEQMFAALKYLGKEVGFVRFPEEGHELSRSGTPSRRLARLHHLIGWFDSHL